MVGGVAASKRVSIRVLAVSILFCLGFSSGRRCRFSVSSVY